MTNFFYRVPYGGPQEFKLWSVAHILVLLFSVVVIFFVYKYIHLLKDNKYEKSIRYTFGILMLLTNITLWIYAYNNNLPWYEYLPEATCGWAVIFSGLALVTKNRFFFVLATYWGFGAVLTLLGSDLRDGPARYNFYQFFLRHIGIIAAGIYLIKVNDFKLYKKDFWTFAFVSLSMGIVGFIISYSVNKPFELNMFYMMQPVVKGTPLTFFFNISRLVYLLVWVPFALFLGYLYGLLFIYISHGTLK